MNTKTTIKAGGGVVVNPEGEILMIFRRKCWDLPKGKLDKGETIEECALREVREECGVQNLALGQFICTTRHEYQERGTQIIKETSWFEMQGSGKLTPQTEEDIESARWVVPSEVETLLKNSYPTIQEVIREFKELQ